jgi:hypothetical protein
MSAFWENQPVESYQKEKGVIEKIGAGNEDFEKPVINCWSGRNIVSAGY